MARRAAPWKAAALLNLHYPVAVADRPGASKRAARRAKGYTGLASCRFAASGPNNVRQEY